MNAEPDADTAGADRIALTLYVSGASPHSAAAVEAIHALCEGELSGRAELSIVDVRDQPALVARDHVLATPTLIKRLPLPVRRLVGGLSDLTRVRTALSLGTAPAGESAERSDQPTPPAGSAQAGGHVDTE